MMDLWLFSGMKLRTKFDTILVAARLTRTIPFNQLCKDDLYANLSFEVESLIIKGMYEVLKNTNPNANDNEIIVRLVQGL